MLESVERVREMMILIMIPVLLGPVLVMTLELILTMIHRLSRDDHEDADEDEVTDTSDRPGQRRVIILILIMVTFTLSTQVSYLL